jgi:hypothetical protein
MAQSGPDPRLGDHLLDPGGDDMETLSGDFHAESLLMLAHASW